MPRPYQTINESTTQDTRAWFSDRFLELSCGPTFRLKLAVNRRFEIADDEWERLASLLPATRPRRVAAGVITAKSSTASCSGCALASRGGTCPSAMGPWQTVYKGFARWQTDGTWTRIEACLRAQAHAAGELDWHAQIDSTIVRAHQHAAGARKTGRAADEPAQAVPCSGDPV
jgi:transposase